MGNVAVHKQKETFIPQNRNPLRIITGLFIEHYPFRELLNKIGLYNGDHICRQYNILCEFEDLDHSRQSIENRNYVEKNIVNILKRTCNLLQGSIMLEWES